MLRIGVDCRCFSHPKSGIARYTHEVLKILVCMGHTWYLYSNSTLDSSLKENRNVTIRSFGWNFPLGNILWFQFQLPYLLRKDKIDLFWSPRHHIPYLTPHNLKTVVTIHDMVWTRHPETMKRINHLSEKLQMPYSVRKANKIIAISHSTKRDLAEFFPKESSKVRVIHNGATDLVRTSVVAGLPENYILFIGTPEPRKNLDRLLAAYQQLDNNIKKQHPLVIVGAHGWNVSLANLIKEYKLEGHIKLLGFVNDYELAYIYSKAKILAMPSLYEGFGLPILEAFKFGIPVLTSHTSSMPEVLGKGGITVSPLNQKAITEGLNKLLTDEKLYADCCQHIKRQLSKFSWDKASKLHWEVFMNCLSKT